MPQALRKWRRCFLLEVFPLSVLRLTIVASAGGLRLDPPLRLGSPGWPPGGCRRESPSGPGTTPNSWLAVSPRSRGCFAASSRASCRVASLSAHQLLCPRPLSARPTPARAALPLAAARAGVATAAAFTLSCARAACGAVAARNGAGEAGRGRRSGRAAAQLPGGAPSCGGVALTCARCDDGE